MANGVVAIKDAKIIFRNFSGEERQFNDAGKRNFNIDLRKEDADKLTDLGFNVRVRPPRDEDSEAQYLLQVSVSYKYREPRVLLINSKAKRELTEDTIGILDKIDILTADLTIRPYNWSMPNGSSGIKAYLNSLYVTMEEDEFSQKYADHYDEDDIPF